MHSGFTINVVHFYRECAYDGMLAWCVLINSRYSVILVFKSSTASTCFEAAAGLKGRLPDKIQPSNKHNSTMDKSTGLISSLFDAALAQDVPFH